MAQAIGYVTPTEAGFAGTLALIGLKAKLEIVRNDAKETDRQPDYRVYADGAREIGGGWIRTGKTSGRDYVSLTLQDPAIAKGRLYANLGRAAGKDDGTMAILWNPAD